MANLYRHPAPGFGDLIPGWFMQPENPIRQASQGGPRGIADLVPARFGIPENPILAATLAGCGCGCESAGMGELDMSSIGSAFDSDIMGIPVIWLLGGALAYYMIFGSRGAEYSYEKRKLQQKYKTRAGAVAGTVRALRA